MPDIKHTTIKLEKPIDGHDGPIHEIVLRDPRYDDYMTLDEPWTYQFTEKGLAVPIDHGPTIALYIERCLVEPKEYLLLKQCSVQDGMAMKKWLTRFFIDAGAATQASTTQSPPSSTAGAA